MAHYTTFIILTVFILVGNGNKNCLKIHVLETSEFIFNLINSKWNATLESFTSNYESFHPIA